MTNTIMLDEVMENLDVRNYDDIAISVTYYDSTTREYSTSFMHYNRKKMKNRGTATGYIQKMLYHIASDTIVEQPEFEYDKWNIDPIYSPARYDHYEVVEMTINKRFDQLRLAIEYTGKCELKPIANPFQ